MEEVVGSIPTRSTNSRNNSGLSSDLYSQGRSTGKCWVALPPVVACKRNCSPRVRAREFRAPARVRRQRSADCCASPSILCSNDSRVSPTWILSDVRNRGFDLFLDRVQVGPGGIELFLEFLDIARAQFG